MNRKTAPLRLAVWLVRLCAHSASTSPPLAGRAALAIIMATLAHASAAQALAAFRPEDAATTGRPAERER